MAAHGFGGCRFSHYIGQGLKVSGVVAVVVASLVIGTVGLNMGISASTRLTLLSFWAKLNPTKSAI
jgi:NhaP-type Na+/H+ or K+/H+ antiporter